MNEEEEIMNACMIEWFRSRIRILNKKLYGTVLKNLLIRGAADIEKERKDRIYLLFFSSTPLPFSPSPPPPQVSALDFGLGNRRDDGRVRGSWGKESLAAVSL